MVKFAWREINTSPGDLNFYNDILEEFTAEDIVSLELDSKGNTTQDSSVVMTTADAVATADITTNAVILDDVDVTNNSCVWCSDQHK